MTLVRELSRDLTCRHRPHLHYGSARAFINRDRQPVSIWGERKNTGTKATLVECGHFDTPEQIS